MTVTGLGSGTLDGGNGRDTLNLGQLSVADAAVVDLNLGSMTVIAPGARTSPRFTETSMVLRQ